MPVTARAALLFLAALLLPASATAAHRTVFLTFDDGPLNGTPNVLDVLQAEQVPAALFMVGSHAEAGPEHEESDEEFANGDVRSQRGQP